MVLNKRVIRDLMGNISKYGSITVLVMISSMLIVGFANSSDCVIETGRSAAIENNLEDGSFSVKNELTSMTLDAIEELGIDVEDSFYVDYKLYENQTLRVFKNRDRINKISITEGRDIRDNKEIVLDTHFGKTNDYKVSNSIKIKNKVFNIVGYGAVPDYTNVIEKRSDVVANAQSFGLGFVSEEEFNDLGNVHYTYAFKLNGASAEQLKYLVGRNATLIDFVKTVNNARAVSYIDDSKVNKNVAIIIGIILCIMIAFMISMSIINTIDDESPIIGALYALGYIKKEILQHFMILPTMVVSIGAIVGTCLGFCIEGSLAKIMTDTYVLPNIQKIYSPYLIFVGIANPIIIVIGINYMTISKKLNDTPLQLLRRERKATRLSKVKIHRFGFITKYRLREFLREIHGNFILFFGIFMATFLLVFGVCIYGAVNKYVEHTTEEATYEYMYILKIPIEITENESIEKATLKGLKIYSNDLKMDMDIMLQGINSNTHFYAFEISENDPGLYISSGVQKKFNLNIGDVISLKDSGDNKVYNLEIKGVVNYNTGLNVFMNRTQLNRLIKEDKSYFNAYLSDKELPIKDVYIFSKTTAKHIIKSAENMMAMMLPIIIVLIVFSCVLFILSMYLLLKLMTDKSMTSISLVKIFGFKKKEIYKLYLGSSLYMIIASGIVSIPMASGITRRIYPKLTANVQAFLSVQLNFKNLFFITLTIALSYIISIRLLKNHIDDISLSEALKSRD